MLILQIAKAYLAATDQSYVKRTWCEVMAEFVKIKTGSNRTRSERATMDKAFDSIRNLQLLETRAEHFLKVLGYGLVSTNNYLRRFHNFTVDMGWLPWPVLPKRQWPPIRYIEKRAITEEEHALILSRETNTEMRAFLWCCWYLGGSQSDIAHLKAEDVDWRNQVVSFFRSKTRKAQIVRMGEAFAENLRALPQNGLLFPRLSAIDEKHRASLFQRACRRVKVVGVSLHSYRYPPRLAGVRSLRFCGYGCWKPLSKPAANAPKFFARVEIERCGEDVAWLNQATRCVAQYWKKKRDRLTKGASASED